MTISEAGLEISPAAYDEIHGLLERAGYQHLFLGGGISGQGIRLMRGAAAVPGARAEPGSTAEIEVAVDSAKRRRRLVQRPTYGLMLQIEDDHSVWLMKSDEDSGKPSAVLIPAEDVATVAMGLEAVAMEARGRN